MGIYFCKMWILWLNFFFGSKQDLISHQHSCDSNSPAILSVKYKFCGFYFRSKKGLISHIKFNCNYFCAKCEVHKLMFNLGFSSIYTVKKLVWTINTGGFSKYDYQWLIFAYNLVKLLTKMKHSLKISNRLFFYLMYCVHLLS